MARPAWLSQLTQHGDKPPWGLKWRSADNFIIGTVALAVFTVCIFSSVFHHIIHNSPPELGDDVKAPKPKLNA